MAAILGLSGYRTPLAVYADKIGESKEETETLNQFLGKQAEPWIAEEYERSTGHALAIHQACLSHPERPYMLATLDAVRDDSRPVEFKLMLNRSRRDLGEEGTDELPDDWIIQGQSQAIVADADRVDFAVASPSWLGLKIFTVDRDESLCRQITEAAEAFWDRVVSRNPPPFSAPSDLRYLSLLGREGESVGLSMDDLATWATYQEMGREISDKQKVRDTLKAHFHAALGTASVGLLPDGSRIVRKLVSRKSYTVAESSHYTLAHKTGDK